MLYLTGSVTGVRHLLDERKLGYMNTPANGHTMNGWIWAADNGCFGKNYVGDERWFAWLQKFSVEQKELCLFATAPDVVGDAEATLVRSLPWLPKIRSIGYKAALVAQDGLTISTCPWDAFDALFVGGSTGWKLGEEAKALILEAKKMGKFVHVGRVNSKKRYDLMRFIGADSADGTVIAFGPSVNAPKVLSWLSWHEVNQEIGYE